MLTDVLKAMDGPAPFAIAYITADRKKRTGGQIKTIAQAQRLERLSDLPDNILRLNRISITESRSPNHYDNKTRNIYIPATRAIRKVHIKLIVGFNGKKVLL